jgi:hypothetical protein
MEPIRILPGQRGSKTLPHSEVCMHMRVSGKTMAFELLAKEYPSVQLYQADGRPFSFPILTGEAGLYRDEEGYYYYPNDHRA